MVKPPKIEKQICVKLIQRLDVEIPVTKEGLLHGSLIRDILEDLKEDWYDPKYNYDGTGTDGRYYEMFWFPNKMEDATELIGKMYDSCEEELFMNCRFELSCYAV